MIKGRGFVVAFVTFSFIYVSIAPPVDQKKPSEGGEQQQDTDEQVAYNLEYERYLQEVVQLLESDPDFRAKIEKADPEDIKSGKIADELDFLHHGLRSKLNEVKRREMDRLRDALQQKAEFENGVHDLVEPGHIDHKGETFEKEDLKRLVVKATKDLEELDKEREKEFKEYEMKKELEWRQQLANMTDEERMKAIKLHNATEKKHNEHPEVIHPGSKAQLEEVWQQVDNLSKDTFDPNTFFQLHDLTGDGYLDTGELETLFQKELDKVYDKDNPEDDMREREEEMARMRQHVMKEWDLNKDGVISRDEFLTDVKKQEFNQDPGWDTLEKKKVYTEDDLKAFAEQWARANGMPVQGLYPPYGGYPYPYPPQYQQQQQPYYPPPAQNPQQGQQPNQAYQGAAPTYQQQQQWPQEQQQGQQQQQQYPPHPGMVQQQQQQWPQEQQGQQHHQQFQQQQGQQQFQAPGGLNQQPIAGNQGQVPVQAQVPIQGQMAGQGQVPIQAQVPGQGQIPGQGQVPIQAQVPGQGQIPIQGQIPVQAHIPIQGHAPGQGHHAQQQPPPPPPPAPVVQQQHQPPADPLGQVHH